MEMHPIDKRVARLGRMLRQTSRKVRCREYGLLLECSYIMVEVAEGNKIGRERLDEVCVGLYNRLCEIEKGPL